MGIIVIISTITWIIYSIKLYRTSSKKNAKNEDIDISKVNSYRLIIALFMLITFAVINATYSILESDLFN